MSERDAALVAMEKRTVDERLLIRDMAAFIDRIARLRHSQHGFVAYEDCRVTDVCALARQLVARATEET